MTKIKVKKDRCKGCQLCISVCPQKVLKLSEDLNKKGMPYAKVVEEKKCTGCGLCFLVCPDVCIEIYEE